jgi:hypothetical protein
VLAFPQTFVPTNLFLSVRRDHSTIITFIFGKHNHAKTTSQPVLFR